MTSQYVFPVYCVTQQVRDNKLFGNYYATDY